MWTLTQISPKTVTVGTFETFAEVKTKINEISGGYYASQSDYNHSLEAEAVYFTLRDGTKFEAYDHG